MGLQRQANPTDKWFNRRSKSGDVFNIAFSLYLCHLKHSQGAKHLPIMQKESRDLGGQRQRTTVGTRQYGTGSIGFPSGSGRMSRLLAMAGHDAVSAYTQVHLSESLPDSWDGQRVPEKNKRCRAMQNTQGFLGCSRKHASHFSLYFDGFTGTSIRNALQHDYSCLC